MARKKKTGKQLVSLEALKSNARKLAEEEGERETLAGGNFLTAQKGVFKLGEEILDDELSVIILDYSYEMALYGEDFDPNVRTQPVCFAVDYSEDELTPHESSEEPQADSCDECELKDWVDGEKPECGQRRRLALIHADCDINDPEILILNLSPGQVKAWKSYPKSVIRKTGLKVHNVITTLSWDQEKTDNYDNPSLIFQLEDEIDSPELFAMAMEQRGLARDRLLEPIRVAVTSNNDNKKSKKNKKPKKRKPSKEYEEEKEETVKKPKKNKREATVKKKKSGRRF